MTFGEKWRKDLIDEWITHETREKISYFYLTNYRDGFFTGYYILIQKGYPKSINYSDLKFSNRIIAELSNWVGYKKITDNSMYLTLAKLVTRAMLKNDKKSTGVLG
jgi:hypothetical protein